MTAFERIVDRLRDHGQRAQRSSGGNTMAQCPAHPDRNPSLALREIEGSVLVKCHAGCDIADVMKALDLKLADLYDEPGGATYEYVDADGNPVREVFRTPDKTFRQNVMKQVTPLYRVPKVMEAVRRGKPIYLVEGEKDVSVLESTGVVATTGPQGAANIDKVDFSPLKGATVIAVVDNDASGIKWAGVVRERLDGYAASLTLVKARQGNDAADHVIYGHGIDDFKPFDGGDASTPTVDSPEWAEPLPLGWHTALPSFPIRALPPDLAEYVAGIAAETQTPEDLAGTIVLGVVSGSIGGRVRVRVRDGWSEPTNLYVVPVADPASRKSVVVAACREPLARAETLLQEELGDEIATNNARREILDERAKKLKARAATSGKAEAIAEAEDAVLAAEKIPVRAWPRLIVGDATPEAVVSKLAEQGGRIVAISAEAGIFASLTGRYTSTPNLEPVLMAHAGDDIRVDRRSRPPERIDQPALTLVASIQPYALRELVARQDFAGRGLLARVLWALPPDVVGTRTWEAQPSAHWVKDDYQRLIRGLAIEMGKRAETVTLTLTLDAYNALGDYYRKVEKLIHPDGDLGSGLARQWGGKLVGAVVRIAGCLHSAGGWRNRRIENWETAPISEATMRAAIEVGEYFRAHAEAALGATEDPRAKSARVVLDVLIRRDITTFTTRELQRRVPRTLQKAAVLAPVLDYLEALGWVRCDGKDYQRHPDAKRLLTLLTALTESADERIAAGQSTVDGPSPVSAPPLTPADRSTEAIEAVSTVSIGADSANGRPQGADQDECKAVSTVSTVSGQAPSVDAGLCAGCGQRLLTNDSIARGICIRCCNSIGEAA